ncbi:MAG: SAM-dependent DNA methyltransferase [Epsilonproteobacteria bacterium]|nr:MAG: SAM-dependent DNA methyltransferase [Campylobacterota bacterium]
MNKGIFNYLRNYSQEVLPINRLLVSSFLIIKNIEKVHNKIIQELTITQKDEKEYFKLKEFIKLLKELDKGFCFEELLELFEFIISPSDKLVNGAIYTPKDIRNYITKQCFKDYKTSNFNNIKVVDISCGCGGFLINAIKEIRERTENTKSYKNIYKDNIFGMDIQKYSIERTKILLALYAINHGEDEEVFEFNLYAADSLKYKWKEDNQKIKKSGGFDVILGNPPYVCSRNMDEYTKQAMKGLSTCTTGHPDLYIPFFQIGFELLKPKGILGYITVNSFIKSLNGRAIRKYFNDNKVDLKIIDFEDEQIFNSRMTYTSICFLTNKKSDKLLYTPSRRNKLNKEIDYKKHKYSDLNIHNGWYLQNRELVNRLETIGTKLGETYNTKSGIATLKNSVYIFTPIKTVGDFYYITDTQKIEKASCKDIVNSNKLVKTDSIDSFIEKIIFPYEYDAKDNVHTIEEIDFKKKYPNTYKYLLSNKDILATRDKGKGKDYKHWHAFGRNQSLEKKKYKLLFPQLVKKGFKSCLKNDPDLYFYNGMAALSDDKEELELLQRIFATDIFWTYVSSISKHYASSYYSLGRNYIKNFGIYNFKKKEKKYLLDNNLTKDKLNKFINKKYCITKS